MSKQSDAGRNRVRAPEGAHVSINRRTLLAAMAGTATVASAGVASASSRPPTPFNTQIDASNDDFFETMEAPVITQPPTIEGRLTGPPVGEGERLVVPTTRGVYSLLDQQLETFIETGPVRTVEPVTETHAIVLLEQDSFPNVLLIDVSTGETIWSTGQTKSVFHSDRGQETHRVGAFDVALSENATGEIPDIIIAHGYALVAYDGETGDVRWTYDHDFYFSAVTVANGTAYATTQDGLVLAVDDTDGQEVFARTLTEPYETIPQSTWAINPVDGGDSLLVTGESGHLWLLEAGSGTIEWELEVFEPDEDALDQYYRMTDGAPTMPGAARQPAGDRYFNVDIATMTESNIILRARPLDPRAPPDEAGELVAVTHDGSIDWRADGIEIAPAGNIEYVPDLIADRLLVPQGYVDGDATIALVEVDTGAATEYLTLPGYPQDDRRGRRPERAFVHATQPELITGTETGGLVAVDEDGSARWSIPAIENARRIPIDTTGASPRRHLIAAQREFNRGRPDPTQAADVLSVRSSEDGTIEWASTIDIEEATSKGLYRFLRPFDHDQEPTLLAIQQRPPTEADDEIRDLDREISDIEREVSNLEREINQLEDEGGQEEAIEALEAEIDDLEDEIEDKEDQIEALGGRRSAEFVAISLADGTERDRLLLEFDETDQLLDPKGVAIFEAASLALIGGEVGIVLVDLETATIVDERLYHDDAFWPPVGEREVEYVAIDTGGEIEDILAIDVRESEIAYVTTRIEEGDIVFELAETAEFDADQLVSDSVEPLGDVTGDGTVDYAIQFTVDDIEGTAVFDPTTLETHFRFEGQRQFPPALRRSTHLEEDTPWLVTATSYDDELSVTVYEGGTRRHTLQRDVDPALFQEPASYAPAALVGQLDGAETLALVTASAHGEGIVLELIDIDTGESYDSIELEAFDEVDPEEDPLIPAITVEAVDNPREGDTPLLAIVADAGMDNSPAVFIVDPSERAVLLRAEGERGEFVELEGDELGLIGTDGSMRRFDPTASVELDPPDQGAEMELSWSTPGDQPHVTTVSVNDNEVAVTTDQSTKLRLPTGTHDIAIGATNPAGVTTYDYTSVIVEEDSPSELLLYGVACAAVAGVFGIGLSDRILRRLRQ